MDEDGWADWLDSRKKAIRKKKTKKCGDDTLKDETTAAAFNEATGEWKTPLGPGVAAHAAHFFPDTAGQVSGN